MGVIQKPTIVATEELKQSLVNLINTTEVPLFVTEMVLENILAQIKMANSRQYQTEKTQYETALENSSKEEE